MHFDLPQLIEQVGYIGIFAIVFAESGLLFGFFLPGDSLLFTAGFLASQDFFNIYILIALCWVAAVTGDTVGYYIGKKAGKKLFNKENSWLFNKDHLLKAEKFYEEHGGKTIILARFTPVIRTFAPIVAGAGNMHYGKFITYNLVGGTIWVFSMCLGGYFLGQLIPRDDIDKYLLPIIGLIVLASIAPGIWHFLKEPENRKLIKHHADKAFKKFFKQEIEK
jgi:membrane-associated protein